MLAPPPTIQKAPGETATEEEDDAAATYAGRPRSAPSDAMQTPQENTPPETTKLNRMGEEGEIYLPTPDARQSPHFETASGKDLDGEMDLGKS